MRNIPVESGWNIVSIPLVETDYHFASVFSNAGSNAYGYSAGYVPEAILQNGQGYWVKFNSADTQAFIGQPLVDDTVNVLDRWNLVGAGTSPIAVGNLVAVPPLVVNSNYYGYSNLTGYSTADSLRPGRGYWVKVAGNGKLVLKSTPGTTPTTRMSGFGLIDPDVNMKTAALTNMAFVDAHSKKRTIWVGVQSPALGSDAWDLPPAPPGDQFDVRFKSQRSVDLADPGTHSFQDFPVVIAGAAFPLVLTWKSPAGAGGRVLLITDAAEHTTSYDLRGEGQVSLIGPSLKKIVVRLSSQETGNAQPEKFLLEQNYPNPFNPSTTIRYYLPVDAKVHLGVYDLLGQNVGIVVDEVEHTGFQTAQWVIPSKGIAGGVYFYTLSATDPRTGALLFHDVKKLLLVK
jgi:hypothetical protein